MSNETDTIALYSGADLASAFDRTASENALSGRPASASVSPAALYWEARGAWRSLGKLLQRAALGGCYEVSARGVSAGGVEPVLARYVGTMSNFQYLMAATFATFEVLGEAKLRRAEVPSAIRRNGGEDLLFVDIELPLYGFRAKALAVPPWVKQRATLVGPWPAFVASLPRDLRKEISRCLRKYEYQGRINTSPAAYEDFYHKLYLPHAVSRFGSDANVATEKEFARYRAGTQLVELVHRGKVVAVNVIRVSGTRMWGLWRGFSREIESLGLKKTGEVVDYFSLLYGACCGVKTVDFGKSRPRLNDGVLLYKSKWGIELSEPRVRKPCMLMVPRKFTSAMVSVLAGTHWIVRHGSTLEGTMLLADDPVGEERINDAVSRYRLPGLSRLRICTSSGFASDVDVRRWAGLGVELRDLRCSTDPLRDYLAP